MAERADAAGSWPVALSVAFPLAAYLATASDCGYWLDSGEFVAQAADFGISHPPGHPLAGVLFTAVGWLLPLGPLAFRVALAGALLTAVAAGALHRAACRTFCAAGVLPREAALLAVAATWLAAGSYGWWVQAVRPEVYALQAALLMVALERLVAFEAAWPRDDPRPLYVASVALGLALANHHFLALLLLPAAAPTMARLLAARGWRPLVRCGAAVAAGLAAYAYLPLRAGKAYLRLGEPSDLERLWWVISAEVFQKNQGAAVPQPLRERFYDVVVQLAESLHGVVLLGAAAGFYGLLRQRATRRIGAVWALVLLVFVAARAWLGWVRSNPDALGYLMVAMAALAVGALSLAAALLRGLGSARATRFVLAGAVVLVAASQFPWTLPRASLAGFRATDAFDEELRRRLPPRSVVFAFDPQTAFRYWGGEAEEALRPDVSFVPVPFLAYPGMAEALVARDESLRETIASLRLDGELRLAALQSLAARRPVFVEPDPRVPAELEATMVPSGLYLRVLADGATDADRREGAEQEAACWARLMRRLGAGPLDPETERQIVWRRYHQALFHAGTGDRDAALLAVKHALAHQPADAHLRRLFEALRTPNDEGELSGPIDTAPFRLVVDPGES